MVLRHCEWFFSAYVQVLIYLGRMIINDQSIAFLTNQDPIFQQILDLYGTPPNWQRAQGFETLCHIILEQQVSLESALSAFNKLKDFLPAFTPTEMLKLTDEELRACYISRQKTKYLRALSEATLDGSLDFEGLNELDVPQLYEQLTAIKGIGNWTAEVYMVFCLQKEDLFLPGDIAAVNTVKELKGAKDKFEAEEIAKAWSPYRSAAVFFLWYYYLKKRGRKIIM